MNLERLFAYEEWANREEIRHLRSLATPPPRALAILAHIVGTQWLWLGRLRHDPPPAVVWPQLTLDQCDDQLKELPRQWERQLATGDPNETIEYVNSKGEHWSSRAEDILVHVPIHGAYHRGQIATLVRQGGEVPAYTDYIHCIRQGFI